MLVGQACPAPGFVVMLAARRAIGRANCNVLKMGGHYRVWILT